MSTLAVTRAPVQTAQRPTRTHRGHHRPVPELHTPNPRTGLSWACEPAEGVQARIPCWNTRSQWLELLRADLDRDDAVTVLRAHHASPVTVYRVARMDAAAADTTTGRNVRTAHATVARALTVSVDAVRRARRVLRDLGWSVETVRGRYMTATERENATRETGSHQRRFASTRCLTIPARVQAMHPYPCGVKKNPLNPSRRIPSTRWRATGTSKNQPRSTPLTRQTPPLGVQKIAARLVQRMPWLDRGRSGHLMGLSRGLVACGVTEEWTTQDLMNAVEGDHQGLGLLTLPPDSQKNPRALLLHQIKRAISNQEPPARARQTAETARREARAAEVAQRAAEAKTKTTMPAWFRTALATAQAASSDIT
ncbi:hypothetical protein [Kocuria sp. CPCC 205233]|uniref:hypothetical protein n=1 Tax=Kocuria sp. CPCC 205233 TaxID=3073550 RepID=UPI0019C23DA7|nr:hypothetical protein GCM10007061_24980 [Kocuria marina]